MPILRKSERRGRARSLAVACAVALVLPTAGAGTANADIVGELLVGATGTGLIVDIDVVGGLSSIRLCGDATLHGAGPLLTGLAIVGVGAEVYDTSKVQAITLTGHDTLLNQLGQSEAAACTNTATLHPSPASTYAVEFTMIAHGTLTLGGVFTATCTGSVVRVVSGPVITINPCKL